MTDSYGQIAFTEAVKSIQEFYGSRDAYSRAKAAPDRKRHLGREEAEFIRARDCFFLASVSETGWPYVQYRGGPEGFLHVLDDRNLGFADFCGNRQYISSGNVAVNDRVAVLLIDFAKSRRLKLFGRMRSVDPADDPELTRNLVDTAYSSLHDATVERLFLLEVEAFDWNCPQHIHPRFTEEEVRSAFSHPVNAVPSDPRPLLEQNE